jgi:hypothetical protein
VTSTRSSPGRRTASRSPPASVGRPSPTPALGSPNTPTGHRAGPGTAKGLSFPPGAETRRRPPWRPGAPRRASRGGVASSSVPPLAKTIDRNAIAMSRGCMPLDEVGVQLSRRSGPAVGPAQSVAEHGADVAEDRGGEDQPSLGPARHVHHAARAAAPAARQGRRRAGAGRVACSGPGGAGRPRSGGDGALRPPAFQIGPPLSGCDPRRRWCGAAPSWPAGRRLVGIGPGQRCQSMATGELGLHFPGREVELLAGGCGTEEERLADLAESVLVRRGGRRALAGRPAARPPTPGAVQDVNHWSARRRSSRGARRIRNAWRSAGG